jgi:hypothetical protein
MGRRHWAVIVSLLLMLGISGPAWSAVKAPPAVNGCWDVTGSITAEYGLMMVYKVDLTLQLMALAGEQFTFAGDNSFYDKLLSISGKWETAGSRVVLTLEESLQEQLSELLAGKYTVKVTPKTSSVTINKKKKKETLSMTFEVDVDLTPPEGSEAFDPGTLTISGSFTGNRGTCPTSTTESLPVGGTPAISGGLAGAIANFLQR